ncbi:hypothetical protein PVAG01_08189 [Phlyctema vagabunda]|uniref:Uncharacterized protein n=1 Tax=Phlyctema vagabunda TaxID=108571 RepID=A0ABR4P9D0_9HELO
MLDRDNFIPALVPRAGSTGLILLTIVSLCLLTLCLTQKLQGLSSWRRLRSTHWLILAIYIDSMAYVIVTAVLKNGFGVNTSQVICDVADWLCLIFYMSTKLIYLLFVEKVHVVTANTKPRMKSKLYLFNFFGMLGAYCIIAILNFVYRIARFTDEGVCIIGMERKAEIPLIVFDVVVNIYLNILFIIPLRQQYSYKNSNNKDSALRRVTFKTLIGSIATLMSSIANLTVDMVYEGEAAWYCFIWCTSEIVFSVVVLHWVTSNDKANGSIAASRSRVTNQCNACNAIPLGDGTQKAGAAEGRGPARTHFASSPGLMREDDEIRMIEDQKRPDCYKVESVKTESVKTQEISWPDSPECEGKDWPHDSPV